MADGRIDPQGDERKIPGNRTGGGPLEGGDQPLKPSVHVRYHSP